MEQVLPSTIELPPRSEKIVPYSVHAQLSTQNRNSKENNVLITEKIENKDSGYLTWQKSISDSLSDLYQLSDAQTQQIQEQNEQHRLRIHALWQDMESHIFQHNREYNQQLQSYQDKVQKSLIEFAQQNQCDTQNYNTKMAEALEIRFSQLNRQLELSNLALDKQISQQHRITRKMTLALSLNILFSFMLLMTFFYQHLGWLTTH
ncbi:hypothetical protein QVN42_08270 [Yersinia nurmii]|uniref:Uncharacterized protein n=1 Tax=Yersinia nurmii TaxID=685706 RepID=A0AAW7JXC0_9GAMM|nr:hypothetical protein [Yersinia nurmii]MDN0087388.1 hypothetical protein [Yersinia nurmii]